MCSTHANFLKCQAKTGPAVIQKSVRPSFDIFAPVCHGLDRPGCRAAMWPVRALGQCAVPAYACRLARQCAAQSPFSGELEADESSFCPKRIRSKRRRGAGNKTIVFSLLKRGEGSIPRSLPMPPKPRCKPLFGAKWIPAASPHRRLARLRRVG